MTGALPFFIASFSQGLFDFFIFFLSGLWEGFVYALSPRWDEWVLIRFLFFDNTICGEFTDKILKDACAISSNVAVVTGIILILGTTFVRGFLFFLVLNAVVFLRNKFGMKEKKKIQ